MSNAEGLPPEAKEMLEALEQTDPDESVGFEAVVEEWAAHGLNCRISKGFEGFNGYVQIPPPGLSQAEVTSLPGRTITYGPDSDGWIGFHTGYGGDYWDEEVLVQHFSGIHLLTGRKLREIAKRGQYSRRWTMDKLRSVTEELAAGVVSLTQGKS